ncbi:MAG: hypothetical protein U1A78_16490 [Polyangia bacterium]
MASADRKRRRVFSQRPLPLVLLASLAALGGCKRTSAPPATAARDGGAMQPGQTARAAQPVLPALNEPPDVLLRAATLALRQSDERSAATLVDLALALLGGPDAVTVAPALGLRDPEALGRAPVLADLSPTGERLAVAHGRLLSLLETEAGYELRRLAPHPAPIRALRLTRARREGGLVATLADDGTVRLLPTGGAPPRAFPAQPPLSAAAPAAPVTIADERPYRAGYLDFSPDGSLLYVADCAAGGARAVGCLPQRLRIFDTATGQLVGEHGGPVELVEYTPRRDGTVALLWAGRPPVLLEARTGRPRPLVTPPELDGPAARDCQAATVPPRPGQRPWLVSPERGALLTQARPGLVCLWDLPRQRLVQAIETADLGLGPGELRLDALLVDGRGVLLGEPGPRGTSHLVELPRPPARPLRRAALGRVVQTMPLDAGGALLTARTPGPGGADGAALVLWRLGDVPRPLRFALPAALQELGPLRAPDAVSGDGRLVVLSQREGPVVSLLTLPVPGQPVRPPRAAGLLLGLNAPLVYTDFIEDAQRLVAVDEDGGAAVLELSGTGGPVAPMPRFRLDPSAPVFTSLRFSTEGDELLVGLGARRLRLWLGAGRLRPPEDLPAREPLPAHPTPLTADSPDGRLRVRTDAAGGLTFLSPRSPGAGLGAAPAPANTGALLRLQVLPGGLGAVALALSGPAAGRFEILGTVPSPGDYLICRAGSTHLSHALCVPHKARPGLVREVMLAIH